MTQNESLNATKQLGHQALDAYESLRVASEKQPETVGIRLPSVTAASLKQTTAQMNEKEVRAAVSEFNAEHGWYMLRDQVILDQALTNPTNLIEGEWARAQSSLKVKLVSHNNYLVTTQLLSETPDSADNLQVYREQKVLLRSGLIEADTQAHKTAHYRLWWQLDADGKHAGRWRPLAQQFAGFGTEEETR